jgi:hypothetical protein
MAGKGSGAMAGFYADPQLPTMSGERGTSLPS